MWNSGLSCPMKICMYNIYAPVAVTAPPAGTAPIAGTALTADTARSQVSLKPKTPTNAALKSYDPSFAMRDPLMPDLEDDPLGGDPFDNLFGPDSGNENINLFLVLFCFM